MTLAPGALLPLLPLLALLGAALAQEYCNTASIGDTIGETVALEGQPIDPDVLTFEISEPDVCPESNPVGLLVSACDVDQGPQVHLLDTTRGLVVREGSLEQTAYVFITFYCPDVLNSDESSIETSESPSLMSQPSPKSQQASLSLIQTWVDSASGSPIPTESSQVMSDSPLDSLPSIQMESRFSELPKSVPLPIKLKYPPPLPPSLSSRWKENESSISEQAKMPKKIEEEQSKLRDSYNSLLSNLKSKFSKESWPSLPSPSWMKTGKPASPKRLSSSLPDAPALLASRTPAWLKRPAKGPSSPWLKLRSNVALPKRRFMLNPRPRIPSRFYDNDDAWSQYEDDTMSLHWSDDHVDDQYHRSPENAQMHRPNNGPLHRWKQDALQESQVPLQQERPSSLPLRHPPNYPSPVHKENPPLLSEWKDKPSPLVPSSKRLMLPKLLLLLQEPDHRDHTPVSRQKCSAHSVEDTEPWWPNYSQSDDGIPWQPEYPSDYSADDGDTWPMGRHTNEDDHWARHVQYQNDQDEHFNHPQYYHNNGAKTPPHKQTLSGPSPDQMGSPQWCPHCPPDYMDYGSQLKARISPTPRKKDTLPYQQAPVPQTLNRKEPQGAYAQPVLTERPLMSSTVRNSVSWTKSKPGAGAVGGAGGAAGEPDAQSPAAPWTFLSRLLLSHPTFRDSTHVIRL